MQIAFNADARSRTLEAFDTQYDSIHTSDVISQAAHQNCSRRQTDGQKQSKSDLVHTHVGQAYTWRFSPTRLTQIQSYGLPACNAYTTLESPTARPTHTTQQNAPPAPPPTSALPSAAPSAASASVVPEFNPRDPADRLLLP